MTVKPKKQSKWDRIVLTGDLTIDLLKQSEDFIGATYLDTQKIKSIGYGHVITKQDILSGRITPNTVFTEAQGHELLLSDIKIHQDPWINRPKRPLTAQQKAALTSLAFNAGPMAAVSVVSLMNQGFMAAAADKFLEYNKVGKLDAHGKQVYENGHRVLVVSASHVRRRTEERALFLEKCSVAESYARFIGPDRTYGAAA
jgi:GH24 family phage-related lysozyme (muramidase)